MVLLTPSGTKPWSKGTSKGRVFLMFLDPGGSFFDLWLDLWLENPSVAPLGCLGVSKLTLKVPNGSKIDRKLLPKQVQN